MTLRILGNPLLFISGRAISPAQSGQTFRFLSFCTEFLNALDATFLCAAESIPAPLRVHSIGFAAAVVKAGGAIWTQVFTSVQISFSNTERGQQGVFGDSIGVRPARARAANQSFAYLQ